RDRGGLRLTQVMQRGDGPHRVLPLNRRVLCGLADTAQLPHALHQIAVALRLDGAHAVDRPAPAERDDPPAARAPAGFEGGGAPPDLREALLEHFLAQRPVAHDPDDRCEHDTAVLAEEELERGIVALAD